MTARRLHAWVEPESRWSTASPLRRCTCGGYHLDAAQPTIRAHRPRRALEVTA